MSEGQNPNSKFTVPTHIPDEYVLAILVYNNMFPFKKIEFETNNLSYSIHTHNDIFWHSNQRKSN